MKLRIFLSLCIFQLTLPIKVALVTTVTRESADHFQCFIESADKYFLNDHQVSYFIFTSNQLKTTFQQIATKRPIVFMESPDLPRALSRILEYKIYREHERFFKGFSYIFICDSSVQFSKPVTNIILQKSVGVLDKRYALAIDDVAESSEKPNLFNDNNWILLKDHYPYETNVSSIIAVKTQTYYFSSLFFGGSTSWVMNFLDSAFALIKKDLKKNIVARNFDESYLNYNFNKKNPVLILSPSFYENILPNEEYA